MKKIYTYLTLFMLALSPAMLTSCDNDDPWYDDYYGWYEDEDDRYNKPYDQGSDQLVDMAQTLNGMWRGEAKNVVYEDNVAYETKYSSTSPSHNTRATQTMVLDMRPTMHRLTTKTAIRCTTQTAHLYTTIRLCSSNGTSTLARTIYIWSMLNRAQSIYSTSMATLTTLVSCLDGATNITRRYLMA